MCVMVPSHDPGVISRVKLGGILEKKREEKHQTGYTEHGFKLDMVIPNRIYSPLKGDILLKAGSIEGSLNNEPSAVIALKQSPPIAINSICLCGPESESVASRQALGPTAVEHHYEDQTGDKPALRRHYACFSTNLLFTLLLCSVFFCGQICSEHKSLPPFPFQALVHKTRPSPDNAPIVLPSVLCQCHCDREMVGAFLRDLPPERSVSALNLWAYIAAGGSVEAEPLCGSAQLKCTV
ncbi:hypothetical protein SKAU_G00012280 [Synaphobranchus kaupii]|uniref:Uncharacterized protein n=1 Tax=Synaphobranchus kaupii TaxID=118154 RepID=A0A9Q1GA78_SYNKA|nr:hypothetical protein SKAU_G00012280 [Synaphobranchus kaupii]